MTDQLLLGANVADAGDATRLLAYCTLARQASWSRPSGERWSRLTPHLGVGDLEGFFYGHSIDCARSHGSHGSVAACRDRAALVATGVSLSLVQGGSFDGTVATFTDANASDAAGILTATIDWGDGTSSSLGAVSRAGSAFAVGRSHACASEGHRAR